MNRLIAVALLLGILSQSLGKIIVLTQYAVNKDYIAATLCVNRAKPEMHCNGKCHLNKELAKEDQREKKSSLSSNEAPLNLIVQELGDVMILRLSDMHQYSPFCVAAINSVSQFVFHPPLV